MRFCLYFLRCTFETNSQYDTLIESHFKIMFVLLMHMNYCVFCTAGNVLQKHLHGSAQGLWNAV